MGQLPSTLKVEHRLTAMPQPTDGRDRAAWDAYWANSKATVEESRRLAAALREQGIPAISTGRNGDEVLVVSAPADGGELAIYSGEGTAGWDRPGTWWFSGHYNLDGTPGGWSVDRWFPVGHEAERDAVLARYPKSMGLKAGTLTGKNGTQPAIVGGANLYPNGVTGAANESGIARLRKTVARLKAEGESVGIYASYGNSFPTIQSLLDAIP